MNDFTSNFVDPEQTRHYIENGPPAFVPGHGGMLQMTGVLLAERVPGDGCILVVGAGGGLETRYLAESAPGWRFVGVDPAPMMLDLARATIGPVNGARVSLIEGTVPDAPPGPYDAATCILVLGMIPDDGAKLATLSEIRQRLKPGAPFILVDQCIDREAPDFPLRLDRYAAFARASGVDAAIVGNARKMIGAAATIVTAARNEALLAEAGFRHAEVFYAGMAWRGWAAYA